MLGAVLIWAIYTIGLQWRPAAYPMLMLAASPASASPCWRPPTPGEVAGDRHIHLHWRAFAALLYRHLSQLSRLHFLPTAQSAKSVPARQACSST